VSEGVRKVVVVGGGIAGLTAAFRLQQAGFDVVVHEASERVGGRTASIERDGFLLDLGASGLSSKYGQMVKLAHDAGVGGQLMECSDLIAVLRDGEVHRLRSRARLDALRTGLLSWPAKLRAARLLLDARRIGERLDWYDLSRAAEFDVETVREYALRRVGQEVLDYLVDPTVRTIYLGAAEEVSIVEFLFALQNFFGGTFLNFPTGMDTLCRALAAQLRVELCSPASAVEETEDGVRVTVCEHAGERIVEADGCVIALSAHQMLDVHPGLHTEQREIIAGLEYSKLTTIHFALSTPPAEPAMVIEIPSREHRGLCTAVFDHNKAPGRAPAGKGLLATFWSPEWNDAHWHLDDAAMGEAARADAEGLFPYLAAGGVEFVNVQRWDPGVLLARPGTFKALQRFHRLSDPRSRIRLAGDYIGGSTTNSALCSGERAAAQLGPRLQEPARVPAISTSSVRARRSD
jgi:oxygen-dependent protoporphyrinogen oxidase